VPKSGFLLQRRKFSYFNLNRILLQTSNHGGVLAQYNALGIAFKAIWHPKPLCRVRK
jgi:hypothetical protein